MKTFTKHRLQVLFTLMAVLLLTSSALASSNAAYQLNWYTADGGGGTSAGGVYTLSGTIGQADAGLMGGGSYTLAGGFWVTFITSVYLPFVRR